MPARDTSLRQTMNKRYFLFLLLVLVLCCACTPDKEDEPPVPEADFVELDADSFTVAPEGGDVVVKIKSNKDWVISYDNNTDPFRNGVLQNEKGEAGESEAVFTAFANTNVSRILYFKVTAGRASATFKIVQDVYMVNNMLTEDELKARLLRVLDETGLKLKWSMDKPLNQWTQVNYKNGRIELFLNEHEMKGKLDLSGCGNLVVLRCAKNQLTEVDVSGCPLLTLVDCTNNLIKKLDVSECYSLQSLYAGYNQLDGIDIGWSTTLCDLYVEYCGLNSIDLSRCVSLQRFSCHNNRLRELDIPHRDRLRSLWCYSNELRHLGVSNTPWLGMFNCGENELENLNLSGCIRLSGLFCYDNRLTELDFSDSKESILQIYCYTNNLKAIDIRDCPKLHELHCSDNDISEIDMRGCRDLGWLYCSYNKIEELDFTPLDTHIFVRLDCSHNGLRKADITSMTYLLHLWCAGNYIGGEIPDWFTERLIDFEHDARYEYRLDVGTYSDRGYGWWYPGEPEKMCHEP